MSKIQCLLNIDTKFDIASFSETYLNEETARLHCIIHFQVIPCFFQNRKDSKHGGIAAFIKSNFKVTVLDTTHTNSFEHLD